MSLPLTTMFNGVGVADASVTGCGLNEIVVLVGLGGGGGVVAGVVAGPSDTPGGSGLAGAAGAVVAGAAAPGFGSGVVEAPGAGCGGAATAGKLPARTRVFASVPIKIPLRFSSERFGIRTICGVNMSTISWVSSSLVELANRYRRMGISLRPGMPLKEFCSVLVMIPPRIL